MYSGELLRSDREIQRWQKRNDLTEETRKTPQQTKKRDLMYYFIVMLGSSYSYYYFSLGFSLFFRLSMFFLP